MQGQMTTPASGADDSLSFLGSLQLADSFFPNGLYTLSYGLEAFAQAGDLDAGTIEALLADYLRHGVGPTDGIALACAHRAATEGDLDLAGRADARLTAVKIPREARETSVRTGRQLLALAGRVFGGAALATYDALVRAGDAAGNHAVALGLTTATLGIPRGQAVQGELYAFAASGIGASVRMAVIDHRVAQVVLHRLKPVIAAAADAACRKDVSDIAGCTPMIDVMAMRHEQAQVRLFMS
jgi:urease accessory protein